MTERLPTVGGDNNAWGTVLNGFLGVSNNGDGTLKSAAITTALGYTPLSTAGGTLTGLLTGTGAGDNQQIFPGQGVTTGTAFKAYKGTNASPDTGLVPVIRAVRTEQVTSGILGDGSEQLAAIIGISTGTASTQGQPVGVFGGASSASTQSGQNDDACGLYGAGRITGGGTGIGIGATLLGRTDSSSGWALAAELHVYNGSGSAGTYNSTGFTHMAAGWIVCEADDCGVGMVVGNPNGKQFEVGYAINGQVVSGKTGGVSTASFRDDGTATRVFDINGSHTDILDTTGATISGKLFKITTPGTYTPTNVSTDRSYDANATTVDELADVVGSLIADLQTLGLVG